MMTSEPLAPPPPVPQHEQDDDLLGPVTKAASKEAEREEKRKEEEMQRAHHSPLIIREKMKIETAQVMAAAAASSSSSTSSAQQHHQHGRSLKKKRQPNKAAGKSYSTPPRGNNKMSVAARARAAADGKTSSHVFHVQQRQQQQQQQQQPLAQAPSTGNRGVIRGKFSAAEAKRLADAWGRDDTSDEGYDFEDDDDDAYYSSYEEGDEDSSPYYTNNNDATTEEEIFHYQHHRVSAYSNRYGRGHNGRTPPRAGNPHNPLGNHLLNNNNNNTNNQATTGGIFSIASNWLQNQREKLHQIELQRQVEEQRRKLVEEGRKQRELEAEKRRERGYAISPPTSPSKHNSAVATSAVTGDDVAATSLVYLSGCDVCSISQEEVVKQQQQQQVTTGGVNNGSSSSANGFIMCGFGGNYALPLDDASDYSGVARIDSSGNVVEMMPSVDLDDEDEEEEEEEEELEYITVRTPKITMSGKGMSVSVDIPDDNRQITEPQHVDIKIAPEPLREETSAAPFLLLPPQMKALLESGALPQSLHYCKWKRLYSLSRDGDSFETFLRMVEGHNRTVLAVKTTEGRLFGGYADTRWEARHKNRQADGFYGSAQACLFRFPGFGGSGSNLVSLDENEVVIYKWTGANRYIQLCDASKRAVAFGGGGHDGDFGLCIEDDFRRGTTGHCSTFENEPLCEEGYFDVVDLEMWGFTLDF